MPASGRSSARLAIALLATATLTSGCVAGLPEAGDAEADPTALVLPWSLMECDFFVWGVPVDAAALEPYLAEGFTVATSDGALTPVTGEAFLGFEAFACASGEGLDGDVAPMTYASLFTSVEPPADLRLDGVDDYYYKWDPLIPDAPRREFLQARGMYARDGAVDVGALEVDAVRGATYTLDGVGTFSIRGAAPPPAAADGGGVFAEFTPLADGSHAVWQAEYTTVARGSASGAWSVSDASWAADVVGTPRGAASFNYGTWSFGPGTLTLPAADAAV